MKDLTPRHRRFNVLNTLIHFHAFPDELSDKLSLAEATVPAGVGAPAHTHPGETEAFYVLDGQVAFMIDGETRKAEQGDFIAIPDGATHAFEAISDARMLVLNAPGHAHEAFFTTVGNPLAEGEPLPAPKAPDIPHVVATAAAHGITILPPR